MSHRWPTQEPSCLVETVDRVLRSDDNRGSSHHGAEHEPSFGEVGTDRGSGQRVDDPVSTAGLQPHGVDPCLDELLYVAAYPAADGARYGLRYGEG